MTAHVEVFVATGAFDCGKTTTLTWLRDHHGLRIHAEAHLEALAALGSRTAGHPPGRPFEAIDDPGHTCPMCAPWDFAVSVLDVQRDIEGRARTGELLERGYLDPIEMLLRNTNTPDDGPRPAWEPVADYRRVLLFDVMPELQRPRWGKSVAERVAEAQAINLRLERLYRAVGYEVVRVSPGSVSERGAQVLGLIGQA